MTEGRTRPERPRSYRPSRRRSRGCRRGGWVSSFPLGRALPPLKPRPARAVLPRLVRPAQDAERAGGDAVPAAVADVVLDVDVAELVVQDRPGRARVLARRLLAVLAHVAQHQPTARPPLGAVVLVDLLLE